MVSHEHINLGTLSSFAPPGSSNAYLYPVFSSSSSTILKGTIQENSIVVLKGFISPSILSSSGAPAHISILCGLQRQQYQHLLPHLQGCTGNQAPWPRVRRLLRKPGSFPRRRKSPLKRSRIPSAMTWKSTASARRTPRSSSGKLIGSCFHSWHYYTCKSLQTCSESPPAQLREDTSCSLHAAAPVG